MDRVYAASMGPQLFSYGNKGRGRGLSKIFKLQWGHNFSVMEINLAPFWIPVVGALQWGHNFSVMEIKPMPQKTRHQARLQWGHNFSVMEIQWRNNADRCFWWLQWGHNFSVMEIKEVIDLLRIVLLASMGPQLFSYGNIVLLSKVYIDPRASMGPQLFSYGNVNI